MKTRFTFFHFFVAFIVLCCNTSHGKICKTAIPEGLPASNIYVDPSVTGFPGAPETSVSAFQLISHGRPGQLLLDGRWMDASQIAAFIAPQMKNSDVKMQHLNIYGCEFGKGEAGKAAVAYLQKALGVSVSASDDITGKNGDWDLEVGTYVSIKGLESYNGNLQYAAGDDFDSDGVINSLDIDDDNDGVLDATESPSCYYTANEWNTLPKPASAVTITSALTTTTSNFSQLLDSINNVSAVTFSNTPAQPIQNVNVYLFTFAFPVKLNALYLKFNTATQFAGTTKIQGSNTNNGTDWVDLSAAIAQTASTNITVNGSVSVTTSIKYPVTLNTATAYKYIRITGVAASNIAAQNASEVYFDINTLSYVSSYYPKASCADANIDGDNILPQFDLDSDGDGCSDAFESGATTNTGTNYQFPDVDANNDGLVDAADADGNGMVNYTSSYKHYAANAAISACLDSDGDGIRDIIDSDDDNDGIPDIAEQAGPSCSTTICDSWITPFFTGASATREIIVDGEQITYTITTNTTFTPSSSSAWSTLQCGLGTVSGFDNWQFVQNTSETVTFNFSKPVTNMQFILTAIENGESVRITTNNTEGQQTICTSCNRSGVTILDAQNTIVNGAGSNAEIFKIGGALYTSVTIKVNTLPASFYMTYGICALKTYVDDSYTDINSDGDGIPNRLDLDSDGDGCPDLKEARVAPLTDLFTPSSTNNAGTSYGIASPVNSQLNPGGIDANNDGLNDSVDPDVNGVPNYANVYYHLATNPALNACMDADNDGVSDLGDIDDDNDGILDAVESPNCFYVLNEVKSQATATSDLFINNSISLAIDGNTATWADIDVGYVTNRTLIDVKLPLVNPATLLNVTVQVGINNAFPASSFRLEGLNGTTWEALSVAQPMITSNTTYTFTNTLLPSNVYTRFRIRGLTGTVTSGTRLQEVNFTFGPDFAASYQPISNCTNDTDGDGVLNHLDLDSDGDGCSDLTESGVSPATDVSTPASTTNNNGTSYGIAANKLTGSQLNPTAADANNDGLNDSVDPEQDGTPNYPSTYAQYAVTSGLVTCNDTDGDGINDLADMDDDNDGIPDITESPACFYTEAEAKTITSVTTELTVFSPPTYAIAYSYDNNTATWSAFDFGQNWVGKALFEITPATPLAIASVNFDMDTWSMSNVSTNTFKLQGWNGSFWVDLSPAMANTTTADFSINNTLQVGTKFSKYKVVGVAGTSYYSGVREITLTAYQYNQALNPKSTCTNDTDGDGILNHLDLDSDGDGCPDKREAGVTNATSNGSYTDSLTIVHNTAGDAGTNGLSNAVETAPDNAIINYASTYSQYAVANNQSVCADTDGDGIPDLSDIDDDNDGILDAVESPACFYTSTEANTISKITSQFTSPDDDQSDGNIQLLHDGATTLTFNFNAFTAVNNPTGSNLFTVEYPLPVRLATLAVSDNISATANANAVVVGSNDGTTWSAALSSPTVITVTPVTFSISTTQAYKYYRIQTGSVAGALAAANTIGEITSTLAANYTPSENPKPNCTTDNDNDGIFNHLDLDSDGDKCPDAYEAGTYNQSGVTVSSGLVQNGSGGAVTSAASTANAVINAPYGGNGFADVLQAVADTNTYKYTYTYNIATDSVQKACCIASNTAPVLTKTSDTICGAATYNLNSIVSGTALAYNAVQWYTDNLHTNLYATPVTAATGTYYAFYKDTINNCFSPASAAFTVVSKPMPVGTALPQTICSGNITSVALNSNISGSTYTWTAAIQSGSVSGFSNCTSGCGNNIAQTLTGAGVVRYTVTPVANACAGNAFTVDVTVLAVPTATIAYSGSPYLSGSGTASVTQTGQTGGAYSATPSGLSLNTATGQVNINSSFADTYTVKYIFSNGTCTDSVAATLTITPTNDTVTTVPTCPTCPVTVCAVVDDVDTTGGATYSTPCGTPAGYTASVVSAGGCITYTPNGTVTDTAQACIVTCNNGKCDTTRVILYPPVPTNDTVITTPTCPTCPVVVCPVFDDVSSTAVTSVTTCGTPAGYTLTGPDVNHCYTYTPNGTVTDTTEACIIVCDGNRCDTTRIIIYPPVQTINHDWNAAFTNMLVTGNAATNDQVYTNTAYGNIQANTNNPTTQTPVLSSNGTYTFIASQPGHYEFVISVCAPGQSTGCPTQLLLINVTDTASTTNAMPIANLDMVTTTYQAPIGIPTLDNDASGNYGGSLNPASVTVTNMPNHGTIDSVGINGDIYYHPDAGFTGTDTLVYRVCDQLLPSNCDTAYQIITVLPLGAANTTVASDDYGVTLTNTLVAGNVLSNDIDPEGNNLIVTPSTINDANGTFIVDDAGNYTFTSVPGFVGSVDYTYQVCDNGSPVSCATATVYILVYPENTTPLPVKITDFTGKAQSNYTNLLEWKAADVKGMDSYEIRRSTDQKNWTSLGSIAAENKDGVQTMHLIDNNPDKEDFYRLVLKDKNGQTTIYPKVVYIRRTGSAVETVSVYPNPAETMVNFEYNSILSDVDIQVEVLDITGRRLKQVTARLGAGKNTLPVSIKDLADGSYVIRYHNLGNGSDGSLKFIKSTK